MIISTMQLSAQKNESRMIILPASSNYSSSILKYNTKTADIHFYNVENNQWIINARIKSPKLTIKGSEFRIESTQGDSLAFPSLFIYAIDTGEYEFFYLKDEVWLKNPYLPNGNVNINSKDLRINFTKGTAESVAYVSGFSTDGKEVSVLKISNDTWTNIDYYPRNLKN